MDNWKDEFIDLGDEINKMYEGNKAAINDIDAKLAELNDEVAALVNDVKNLTNMASSKTLDIQRHIAEIQGWIDAKRTQQSGF